MKLLKTTNQDNIIDLITRPVTDSDLINRTVSYIIADVMVNGDKSVLKYTKQFSKIKGKFKSYDVKAYDMLNAEKIISYELKEAIHRAKQNIEKFHLSQMETVNKIETEPGILCWRKSVPITNVGLYVPGGTAPLISTVLMLAVPACLVGCQNVIICTPPDSEGNVNPALLYAARLAGVNKIFKVGGAQAIAAMAYGTQTVPKVDKIFGPGNLYVTLAKQLVCRDTVAIDMPAGPSELLIIADKTADKEFVAADLLSQAEHGKDSQVILISDNLDFLLETQGVVLRQLNELPKKKIAEVSLHNSFCILVRDMQEAMEISNAYAPEHLILACKNAENLSNNVINAGSVFIGNYASEAIGDYASGTNHTLPTNGSAKAYSGVSIDSFMKKITFQYVTEEGIKNIGNTVEILAEAENLFAHKNAITVRLNKLKK
ncbi:MAG: histidinol dehydrogenase [Bacteroidales bacterium]|nr:histidinol dehydrogenase [Bacteroidales bacterium]